MPYKCLLCGRDKFTKPGQAHHCRVGFANHFGRIASKRGMECVFVEVGAQQGKPAGLLLAAKPSVVQKRSAKEKGGPE